MRFVSCLIACGVAFLVGRSADAEPFKIRLSYIVPVSNWASILFVKPELATHMGKSYTYEAVHFQNTSVLLQGLAAGEVEIANLGFTTLPLAIVNAGMKDIRLIADELQDGVPGYYSDEYMVLKDSPIKNVEDLKGKILADGGIGSGLDIPLRAILAKHGLQDKRDKTTIIESPIPTLGPQLLEKKVDLVALPRPFTADPKLREATRTLFTQGDAMGVTQLAMWVARAPMIEKNRAAMVDFMEDAIRAERWYLDPAHHDEAVKIAVEATKIPAPVWESWLFKKDGQNGDYYRAPDGKPDVTGIQASMEIQKQNGLLREVPDLKNYLDLSLVEEASRRLR
jgi:sulfonate transport system substrate-binding protein